MAIFLRAASIGGSILVVIALAIALLKALIAFVGFISVAVKILIFLVFVCVFAAVGYLMIKTWRERKRETV